MNVLNHIYTCYNIQELAHRKHSQFSLSNTLYYGLYSVYLTIDFLHSGFPETEWTLVWFVLYGDTIWDKMMSDPHCLVRLPVPLSKAVLLGDEDLKRNK